MVGPCISDVDLEQNSSWCKEWLINWFDEGHLFHWGCWSRSGWLDLQLESEGNTEDAGSKYWSKWRSTSSPRTECSMVAKANRHWPCVNADHGRPNRRRERRSRRMAHWSADEIDTRRSIDWLDQCSCCSSRSKAKGFERKTFRLRQGGSHRGDFPLNRGRERSTMCIETRE